MTCSPRRSVIALTLVIALSALLIVASTGSNLTRRGALVTGYQEPAALSTPPVSAAAVTGQYFDYVLIIVMENHALCDILTTCGGSGPYETTLANHSGLSTKSVDCTSPSLPNYLCLSGASDFGCNGYDGLPLSNNCTAVAWNSTNIVDRVAGAGLTWKAYMEGMPANCDPSDNGTYMAHHDPFVYYADIATNATRCARVVPAGANDSTLLTDLAATSTASHFMWLTPDSCNDMHDCSVATGDAYLQNLVPKILSSAVFTTQRAALFLTYDEDSGGNGTPYIYTSWAGPAVKTNYVSAIAYDHFSFLKTIEANWNLPALNTNDSSASSMAEFFTTGTTTPDFTLTANPAVANAAAPGVAATSTLSVAASGGFTGTVALTWSAPPAVSVSVSPTSLSGSQTATVTMSATAVGAYSVAVTGSSGSLVRTATITFAVGAPPTAAFTFAPTNPVVGEMIDFVASSSNGTPPYTYVWAWGDASAGTGASATHNYSKTGNYSVRLNVTDSLGLLAQITHKVVVGSGPIPTGISANFTFTPVRPAPGDLLNFSATAARGAPPYTFSWQFGDGAIAFGANVNHAFSHRGNYSVNLTVTDTQGRTTLVVQRLVVSGPPPPPPPMPSVTLADLLFLEVAVLGVVVAVAFILHRRRDEEPIIEDDSPSE